MPEPTSSGVAGAAVAYKAFGGTAAAVASGATLAAVVVMLMTPPRDKREWAVGLISTVVSSIGGARGPRAGRNQPDVVGAPHFDRG